VRPWPTPITAHKRSVMLLAPVSWPRVSGHLSATVCSPVGCNPPPAVSRSWWSVPRVSAAWMPPSSLHGGIHGVPWRDPPRPNLTHRRRRVTPGPNGLRIIPWKRAPTQTMNQITLCVAMLTMTLGCGCLCRTGRQTDCHERQKGGECSPFSMWIVHGAVGSMQGASGGQFIGPPSEARPNGSEALEPWGA
jgi:hypothetical protein